MKYQIRLSIKTPIDGKYFLAFKAHSLADCEWVMNKYSDFQVKKCVIVTSSNKKPILVYSDHHSLIREDINYYFRLVNNKYKIKKIEDIN